VNAKPPKSWPAIRWAARICCVARWGKRRSRKCRKQRETFVKGAHKTNNIFRGQANQVFDLLEKFAGYGFNKSQRRRLRHCCVSDRFYLKANYPVEFLSAMMTNDMGDMAKLGLFHRRVRD